MACQLLNLLPSNLSFKVQLQPKLIRSIPTPVSSTGRSSHVRYVACSSKITIHAITERRSGNYNQNIWDHDFVQSLKSEYTGHIYTKQLEKLMEEVRSMFDKVDTGSSSSLLKLIDTIQRLGVNYHFHDEIKGVLDTTVSINDKHVCQRMDLYTRALKFRLLRQHGYEVSQDLLKSFKEEIMRPGDLNEWTVEDREGMLSLYEASFYGFEGEEIIDEAQEFTTRHLKEYLKGNTKSPNYLSKQINHALELPLHWRVPRIEARWFIDNYSMMKDMDPLLLEFARLDFNMVQAIYQEDLKYVSRWWRKLDLAEALSFARNNLVENFFWSIGFNFEPKFGYCRRQITKVASFITIMMIFTMFMVLWMPSSDLLTQLKDGILTRLNIFRIT